MISKVSIRSLDVATAPRPATREGGRFMTAAGELAQIVNGSGPFSFLAFIEFKDDVAIQRGNHYHEKKEEFLYVIRGCLRAAYEDVETGAIEEVTVRVGDLVHVMPRCAHTYCPLTYSEAVEFSAAAFDPTDTYKYAVKTAWLTRCSSGVVQS